MNLSVLTAVLTRQPLCDACIENRGPTNRNELRRRDPHYPLRDQKRAFKQAFGSRESGGQFFR
jgi:hypothetical protein